MMVRARSPFVRIQNQLVNGLAENDAKVFFFARGEALPFFQIESVDFFVFFECDG